MRAKLQLFSLLLVVVPGALIAALTVGGARLALEQAVGRQLAEVAHDTLDEVASTIAEERANVRDWARQDVLRDVMIGDLDKRVTRFLLKLTPSGTPYPSLVCTDRTGRVIAATDPAEVGAVLTDRAWVRTALAGEEFLAGPGPIDPTGHRTVEIAAPIRDPDGSGLVIGALLERYDWSRATAVVDRIQRTLLPHGLTVDILLFDGDGRLLDEQWHEGAGDEQPHERLAAGEALVKELRPDMQRGYVPMPAVHALAGYERGHYLRSRWLAVVVQGVGEAFKPIRETERRLLVGLAAVLLAALVVATYFAERMSRPLRALTRAVQEVAHGGVPERAVAVRSRDEIGQLATAFNTMAGELERAQQDLLAAAKFAFVGEVAAGIAHEVRTPLGILRSSAQMIERSVPKDQPETVELASMMIEEVDRLDRVVDGLLELARPHEPLVEPTVLETVLSRALDFVDARAREKGIALERDFAAATPQARCDPEQIYQVALNLIVNALQILPAGGHVAVRTLACDDGRVAFEVRDDGPGVPPDVRERIFTPFFSLRSGGTGLGLALVHRVVHEHQGTVSVESAVGGGTTFRVELPVAGDAT